VISFATPYWTGPEMMAIHLASIRRFHPAAPILVSKRGGGAGEMEAHRERFGVRYWVEECSLIDAHLRLLKRCETEFVCVLDHDVVLLASLDPYVAQIRSGRYDLLGVEERIREPPGVDWRRLAPEFEGWLRLAPGQVTCNFIVFNVRAFLARWGLRGVIGRRPRRAKDYELDYGVGQRLTRHKYLLPYHTRRYGLANVLMDGETAVAWHQWYGSHRARLTGIEIPPETRERVALVEGGERACLADYPRLDLSALTPAWGPERDVDADLDAIARRLPGDLERSVRRLRRWWGYGAAGLAARVGERLARWRELR